MQHPLIELRAASKTYGTGTGAVTALRETTLTIAAGEFVAIVGQSGSGKSTLMNLIGLLDSPSQGLVWLNGQPASRLDAKCQAELRNRHIGFVFQAYHLMPRRSALANVELPLTYRGERRRVRQQRASVALDAVGLSHRAGALPAEMSGGEQQRTAIARALVTKPDLIIADEPTGALDSASGELVLQQLEAACTAGRTVIMVTHDATVAARAERRITMRDGQITDSSHAKIGQLELA